MRKLKPVEKITLTQLYGLLVMKGVIVGSYKRLQHILAEANRWGLFNKGNLAGRYKGIDDEKLLTLRKLYL